MQRPSESVPFISFTYDVCSHTVIIIKSGVLWCDALVVKLGQRQCSSDYISNLAAIEVVIFELILDMCGYLSLQGLWLSPPGGSERVVPLHRLFGLDGKWSIWR